MLKMLLYQATISQPIIRMATIFYILIEMLKMLLYQADVNSQRMVGTTMQAVLL